MRYRSGSAEWPITVPVANRGGPRPSAISQALKAISDPDRQTEEGASAAHTAYQIRVASNAPTRERAYRLAQRIYRSKGFVAAGGPELCIAPYDARSTTLTLLAQGPEGRDVATLTVVLDAADGLPCDEIYATEVQGLRQRGCRLAEFTRLALDEGIQQPRAVLLGLFDLGYIFARQVLRQTDLLIEVNPRHVEYYRRMLAFEIVGAVRPCPRVCGAPAVLLHANLARTEAAVRGADKGSAVYERLNSHMLSQDEELHAVKFLRQKHRPMQDEERSYFRLPAPPDPRARPAALAALECGAR